MLRRRGRHPGPGVVRRARGVGSWGALAAFLAGGTLACSSAPETIGGCTIEPGTECPSAPLAEADLAGADLADAELREANLYRADLTDANLRHADLAGADLAAADLRGADLTGADLTDAQLTEADLRGASLARADLTQASLGEVELAGADLSDADLSETGLGGVDLSDVDLAGAALTGTWLEGTDLSDVPLDDVDPAAFSPRLDGAVGLDDGALAAALDVPEAELARALTERQLQMEPIEDIQAAVSPACDGTAVPDAGTAATGSFRPIVADPMALVGGEAILPTHQPVALRFARLVLCDDFSTRQIGECGPYEPGPGMLPVMQERLVVRIVEARTATEVATRTFEGSPSFDCPGVVQSRPCDLTTGVGCTGEGSWPDISQEYDLAGVQQFVAAAVGAEPGDQGA